jgi:hypothetical protein
MELQAYVQELLLKCSAQGIYVPPLEDEHENNKGSRERLRFRGNSASGKKKIKKEVLNFDIIMAEKL